MGINTTERGLFMAYQPKRRWPKSQEIFLKDNYGHMKDEQIADILKRSVKSVRRKRERMELPKESGRSICKARKEED